MVNNKRLYALLIMLSLLLVASIVAFGVNPWSRSPGTTPPALPGGTANGTRTKQDGPPSTPLQPFEQPVTTIPLGGPLADRSAEISGLAWYGDHLILLPQYPHRATKSGEGYVYALPKTAILAYLDGSTTQQLEPLAVPFEAHGLKDQISDFEGFESIGFAGDRVYLTIESGSEREMMGYLVGGRVAPDLSRVVLDAGHLVPIEPQAGLNNKADEALLVLDDRVITFYEANGASINPHPFAHVFDLDLNPIGTLPIPSLEYRITDAARMPGGSRFWVINTFVLPDLELLPASDPLADRFGKGPTHSRLPVVERLVEMQYDPSGVTLTGDTPLQLQLEHLQFRNWEGLVLLEDRGFLLATDKHPATILAFVPMQ